MIFAISYFMRAAYPPDASAWVFVAPLLVQGVAMGMFFVALVTISLDGLPPERVPAASGLNNFLRITSGSLATSLTATYWDRREALHQSRLVESLSGYNPGYTSALAQLRARGFGGDSAIPLCWLVRRPEGGAAAGAAELIGLDAPCRCRLAPQPRPPRYGEGPSSGSGAARQPVKPATAAFATSMS